MSAKDIALWLATESLPAVAVRRALSYAPTVQGRATRTELLATVLIVLLVSAVSFFAFPDQERVGPWQLVTFLQMALLLLPLGSAVVRRLHDTGRNGFAVLIAVFPYIGWLWLLGILLWDGDPYETQYGPPPR